MSLLPPLPKIVIAIAREVENASARGGFVDIRRLLLTATYDAKTQSAPFQYDVADRRALDAAVIVPHFRQDGVVHVYLRSSLRPPLALRTIVPLHDGSLWELPAGLIEIGEAPQSAARRELEEEIGFHVPEDAMIPLGGVSSPTPALIGELHHYFHVNVDGLARKEPEGDGSPLEAGAAIISRPLDDLLHACRQGLVMDAKTELALRRLKEVV